MQKIKANTIWILAGTVTTMIILLFAVIKIYNLTLNETKRSHQLQQMEMAKAARLGIKTYLDHLSKDLLLLTSLIKERSIETIATQKDIDHIFNLYDKGIVRSIFISDLRPNILFLKGESLPEWIIQTVRSQNHWFINPENHQKLWFSQINTDEKMDIESGLSFLMLTPLTERINRSNKDQSDLNSIGCMGYLLNFEMLIQRFISPLKLSKNDFAWIMDGEGRLIYHPRHSEMLLRTTKEHSSSCISCHASFDIQNDMINSGASKGEYVIGDEPKKVMAYVPLQLYNEKWILVISTFLPEVTANLRENFQLFFILGIIILAFILSLGLSLYYVNTKRIRAEESQRQYEKLHLLQEQLNQASKLASIGELVDTMAHEINTPAGIITAQADALLLQTKSRDTKSEEIEIIKEQTRRISKYTKSLLSYSKRLPFHPKPTRLEILLDESVYLLGHRFRANRISLNKNYTENLPSVYVDRGQIEQVFINLLNNAVDALNGPGEINIDLQVIHKNSLPKKNGVLEWIKIDISDNGEGISEEDLPQIFEPFFSKKLPSKGTGLGLYISRSIIQRHRGRIQVVSTVRKGTTFSILLPLNFGENF